MTYTGFHDVKAGRLRPRTVEEVLDYADVVREVSGRPLHHKALDLAANSAEKMQGLRRARTKYVDDARNALTASGLKYAAGKVSAEDVLLQAVTAAGILTNTHEVQRLAEVATEGINRQGMDALAKLSEEWWFAGLKARAAELLQQANQVADELAIEPAPRVPGMVSHDHPWAPSRATLEGDIRTRHAWEQLEAILSDLDHVHSIADGVREMGYAGTVAGREASEDYRWRHVDRLSGNPAAVREFFLANRGTGEPGLYTAAELTGTAPPQVREAGIREADRYTAAVLQDAL